MDQGNPRKRQKGWDTPPPELPPPPSGVNPIVAAAQQAAQAAAAAAQQQRAPVMPGTRLPGFHAAGQAPTPAAPPPMPAQSSTGPAMSADAIARAREVAARLVQAKNPGAAQSSDQDRDVTINDAPAQARMHLLKRPTQTEMERRTGTIINVKGRFYLPGQPQDPKEKPLHLNIRPGAHAQTEMQKAAAVQAAVAEIHAIIAGRPLPAAPPVGPTPPGYAYPGYQPALAAAPPPAMPPAVAPIMVMVNISNPPAAFNLPDRIRGLGGMFLSHIMNTTGATVQLRGQGSQQMEGPDPLHVYIAAPTQRQLDDARNLTIDLLNTIKDEFIKLHPYLATSVAASTIMLAPPAPAPVAPPAPYYPLPAAAPPPGSHPAVAPPAGAPVYAPPPQPVVGVGTCVGVDVQVCKFAGQLATAPTAFCCCY
ncbi:hypothetical protein DUNSADRAFT_13910 [Dunaliella salina]|uniref:K Homology domain-containing protein n=1 Tax=Dunaliella salina TaxID=3046 RepID=A0ABQ7G8G6_DUNSA|nr:hypothetical protein DUNSADRAFT_13910 [Dunaliella salina]|eukprot:KAF5830900.1 hypothetical protein DUNSADRAFT_13910 [Dunaliella salina]